MEKTGLVDPQDSRFTSVALKFSCTVWSVVGKQIVLHATEISNNEVGKKYEYRYTIKDENVATDEGVNCMATIGLDKFTPVGEKMHHLLLFWMTTAFLDLDFCTQLFLSGERRCRCF